MKSSLAVLCLFSLSPARAQSDADQALRKLVETCKGVLPTSGLKFGATFGEGPGTVVARTGNRQRDSAPDFNRFVTSGTCVYQAKTTRDSKALFDLFGLRVDAKYEKHLSGDITISPREIVLQKLNVGDYADWGLCHAANKDMFDRHYRVVTQAMALKSYEITVGFKNAGEKGAAAEFAQAVAPKNPKLTFQTKYTEDGKLTISTSELLYVAGRTERIEKPKTDCSKVKAPPTFDYLSKDLAEPPVYKGKNENWTKPNPIGFDRFGYILKGELTLRDLQLGAWRGSKLEAGKTYQHGLVMEAPHYSLQAESVSVTFKLDGKYRTFEGTAGLSLGWTPECAGVGSARFKVQLDGQPVRSAFSSTGESKPATHGDDRDFNIDVSGVNRLTLIVEAGDKDNHNCANAVWADAKLSRK